MKVIFLVRYPVGGFIWTKEEFGMRAALEAKKLVTYYSWEENLRRAANRISRASELLICNGIEASVDVYAGSLKKAVRNHSFNGDVYLIVKRVGLAQRLAMLFNVALGQWSYPSFSAVQLIHPRAVV